MPWDQVLKQEVLVKRATGRGRIKTYGLKDRLFVLTPSQLSYYEGNEERRGKEKGCLELNRIKAVERVDDQVFEKGFCFQVLVEDFVLYIFAKDDKQREEWVQILREEVQNKNDCLVSKFHSGAFINNEWTCCKEKSRAAQGCKNTHFANAQSATSSGPSKGLNNTEKFKVTAKYDYQPTQVDDLPLRKDEEYIVVNSLQKNWWFARDDLGREGYIPSNYVVRHVGIECEKWYHGDMTRQEADVALKTHNQDGTFVVRNSSQQGMYTLSFCFQNVVKHYHIKLNRDGHYYVSQRHTFKAVTELIEYHRHNSAGLVTRLRFPYTGSDAPPVTLGYGIFQIDRNELRIKRQIGVGQFGTVYEALWRDRTKVAVKEMKPGSMLEIDFIDEAKIMHRFQHKNLITTYGVCSLQSPLYIIIEYMPHGSLLDFLRKNKYLLLKCQTLTDMVFQVSAAMKYLEEEKFIHRDLAARNCLVGENYLIKVGDFGLARYVLDDQYTASEGTKFPVKWASPEVIDYTKFSSKSDVWAFGILCWEVFTAGKSPYANFSNPQVAEEVRTGYRLSKPGHCSSEIFDIMRRCWEQMPENRPSFKDIHASLQLLTEDYSD